MPRSAIPAPKRVLAALLDLNEADRSAVLMAAEVILARQPAAPQKARTVKPAAPAPVAATPRPITPPSHTRVVAPVAAAGPRPPRQRRRPVLPAVAPAATETVVDEVVGLEPPDAAPEPAEG